MASVNGFHPRGPVPESFQSVPTGGAPRAQDMELLNRRVMSRQFISRCPAPRPPTDFILLTEKPGLQFPIKVKDDQGQLLWEKRTEMMLPAGSFFHSVSQVQPAPRRGVWLAPFFYLVNQRKSCPPNWVDAVQYNPEWHL